jgi:chloramphenicol-sensitive protein RarD
MASSALIGVNWFLFIWAVMGGHAVEASLGYYIFPLISAVIGVVVFRERPVFAQVAAVVLALAAVLVLTLGLGVAPWVALTLGTSFAAYAAVKKGMATGAVVSVTMEVLLLTPLALGVLIWTEWAGEGWFLRDGLHAWVLPLSGVISGGPLILFSYGARRVRLVTSGLVQYLNPSLQFLSAVFVMGEGVTRWHGIALAMIWAALALYSAAAWREDRARSRAAMSGIIVN